MIKNSMIIKWSLDRRFMAARLSPKLNEYNESIKNLIFKEALGRL